MNDMYSAETFLVHVQAFPGIGGDNELGNMTHGPANNASLAHQRPGNSIKALSSSITIENDTSCGRRHGPGSWTEERHTVMTQTEVTLLATILVTVFLSSVIANALVCLVFCKRRSSLSLSNRFLANLTVCNCLFTLLVVPFAFVSLLSRQWLFGPVMCQCTGLAVNLLVTASIFTLAVISLDRHCAVVTPLHYTMRMTRRRCWASIAGIWIASLAVSFPPLVGWNSFKFHVNKMICTVAWDSDVTADRYYTLFLVAISFLLPLAAMLWTYGCIFRAARDNSERTRRTSIVPTTIASSSSIQSDCDPSCQCTPIISKRRRRRSSSVPILRRLSQTSCRSSSLLQRREEWKTAVTSFLILFSFMLCWLPYFVVILCRSLAPSLHLHPVLSTISTVAAMFACACNPLVYVFRNKGMRRDLKVIITRRRSFTNEMLVQSLRGRGAGSGGRKQKVEREKGSVFWPEDGLLSHGAAAECPSIAEGSDARSHDAISERLSSSHSTCLATSHNTSIATPCKTCTSVATPSDTSVATPTNSSLATPHTTPTPTNSSLATPNNASFVMPHRTLSSYQC